MTNIYRELNAGELVKNGDEIEMVANWWEKAEQLVDLPYDRSDMRRIRRLVTDFTCQICGRTIKAKNGKIAHHGYTRPGDGWQTASCAGARYLPYEVSCERIPPVLEALKAFIEKTEKNLKNFKKNPPESLEYQDYMGAWGKKETKTVQKPANFDPKHDQGAYSPVRQRYEMEFFRQVWTYERTIKSAGNQVAFLEKRLADWKAPITDGQN